MNTKDSHQGNGMPTVSGQIAQIPDRPDLH